MDKENISPLQFIKGVGPKRAKALLAESIETTTDLVNYYPRTYIDRTAVASLQALSIQLRQENFFQNDIDANSFLFQKEVLVIAQIKNIKEHTYGKNRKMLKLNLSDSSGGRAEIIFWNYTTYYSKIYKQGETLVISGKPEISYDGKVSFSHPDIEFFDPEDESSYSQGGILPIYKLTDKMKSAGINIKWLRKIIASVLDNEIKLINENLPDYLTRPNNLLNKKTAIKNIHFPESSDYLEKAKMRMKFEEIFYFEVFLALQKKYIKVFDNGLKMEKKGYRIKELVQTLPFKLTDDQKKVWREILDDLESGEPMNRLLQGDVGSGKTIVAILAMLKVIDNGFQTAMMAPTEILAEQHYHTLKKFLEPLSVKIVQLVGGQKTKMRREVLEKISSGEADIICGTHALFESEIEYKNLGLIIIDEQHRFGVVQRADMKELAVKSLQDKSISPHIFVMSATPIPRTLSLTLYGDLDVSTIKEMPKDRKPIKTKVVFESQLKQVYDFISSKVQKGFQAYIVYPLVEKSEKLELKSATENFEYLQNEIFPNFKCGLLHGQMFWYQKEEAMKAFLNKEYQILVTTTVVEVGIDVPNATVMLIQNAERFGLSQLHQLRGRVGRGSEQSFCFLATKDNYQYQFKRNLKPEEEPKAAYIRLKTMEETTDGFQISEVDMKLRGPGDILGTRQSGLPSFKFLSIINDTEVIEFARNAAFDIVEKDPQLRNPENRLIRDTLFNNKILSKNYYGIA